MKTRLLVPAALLFLSGCAGLMSNAPPQFAQRQPLWIYPKDVDAWVIPPEVGYGVPCTKQSHDFPPPSHDFHCHPWIIARSTGLFRKPERVILIYKPNRAAERRCTIAEPCPSPVRPCERPCVGLNGDTVNMGPLQPVQRPD